MSAQTSAQSRAQAARMHWEGQKWTWKWLVIAMATLSILVIFFVAEILKIGLLSVVLGAVFGAIGWQILALGVVALFERVREADTPRWTKPLLVSGLILSALLVVSFWTFIMRPELLAPILMGAPLMALMNSIKRSREIHRPRCFVEIENTGDVISLKKGAMLIGGLQEAGYKLITQCNAQGECATCRVKVIAKNQNFVDKNFGPVLTPRQKNEGWVIACQVPVEGDMKIRLYKPLMLRWPMFSSHNMLPVARELRSQLPGFDCEACGYNTCDEFAQAAAQHKASPEGCFPGGEAVSASLKKILSQKMEKSHA